jgi:hypothetical protein
VILHRKGGSVRLRRYNAPEPPFWCATAIAPYSGRRATPVAIDYSASRATGAERLEVLVCDSARDELERAREIRGPVVIEAAEATERVFRRGEDVLAFCDEQQLPALHLVSTNGVLPQHLPRETIVAIAAWPLDLDRLRDLATEAHARGLSWGAAVPIFYPHSTELVPLAELAGLARDSGALFLASIPLLVEATAKQAIAKSLELDGEDDRYALLFHGDLAPLHLATERHIAALAHDYGLADFIVPPRWSERSNWNGATLLTLIASRMIAMEMDLDLAGQIARSSRIVAELDKPLTRVAEAASLSIIDGLDETSVETLTEWLRGETPAFLEEVNEVWRLSRSGGA